MINFFSIMMNVSTILALGASAVFFIRSLFNEKDIELNIFQVCNNQIRVCQSSSVIFTVLYWFVVSGFSTEECLKEYEKLSAACLRMGYIWIIFAFVNIVISILLGLWKRGKNCIEIMGKLRMSGFVMGAVFLIFSYILKVN